MLRFYFHLASRNSRIPDDTGKELSTLNDAYNHARKLIAKIKFYVGEDDASEWNVIISNDIDDAQIIVPFLDFETNALATPRLTIPQNDMGTPVCRSTAIPVKMHTPKR
jgi:hypothetical protein